jgi:Domain of Unknown Function (DUF928)
MKISLREMPMLFMTAVLASQGMAIQSDPSAAPPGNGSKDASQPPKQLKRVHARKLDGFELSPQPASAGTQVGGASRGIGTNTTLLAPRKAQSYSLNPLFQWANPNRKITSYRFRLLASNRETVLFETEVGSNSLKYPNDAPALTAGGDYFWTVQPSISLLGEATDPAELIILRAQQRSELDGLLGPVSADPRARARVFVEKRLWYDAIEAYNHLISANPDERELFLERAELYEQLPQTKEAAEQDRAKAGLEE